MSAYFEHAARPVLDVLDAADLRTEPSANLRRNMIAVFASPGLFRVLAVWDDVSTAVDNGTSVWKPDDLGVLDPGRWLVLGGESAGAHTYVKRKVDGSIDGLTADFSNPVVRVNYDIGANDPVPAVLCGLSVDRGAIAGVERDRAALIYDEASAFGQSWHVGYTTLNDSTLTGTYIPIISNGFWSNGSGGATSGIVRLRQDETLTAHIAGTTYDLVQGTAAGVATFGDDAIAQALLHADGDVRIRSVNADVELRTRNFQLFDSAGANQLVDASVTGDYFRVIGDLEAYDGATRRLSVDVSAALASFFGTLRFDNATAGVSADFALGSTPQTLDAVATTVATIPVPASGSVTVLSLVKGVQDTGANGFSQIAVNSARRNGGAAPTLSQGLTGLIFATLENTFAITRPSVQFVISGNDLLIQVVGKAATTINWLPMHWLISR